MLSRDRGSALMLMPAAVLIVMVLAAITMDLSLVHLARREAVAAAEAAANDAVTYAFDEASFRADGRYALSGARVHDAVERTLTARGLNEELVGPPVISIRGTTVEVRLTLQVDYVFARAIPGSPDSTTLSTVGSASPIAR